MESKWTAELTRGTNMQALLLNSLQTTDKSKKHYWESFNEQKTFFSIK